MLNLSEILIAGELLRCKTMMGIGIGRELRYSLRTELLIAFGLLKLQDARMMLICWIWVMRVIY